MEYTDETHFPKSRASAREARRWLAETESDLPVSTRDLLVLMISEVVTNSVVHGDLRVTDVIDVRVRRRGDVVRIEVHDPGRGFDVAEVFPPTHERLGNGSERGYGLRLVDTIATAWGVDESRPTTVWFELEAERAS